MPNETPPGDSYKNELEDKVQRQIPTEHFLEDDPRSRESMVARGGAPPSAEEVAKYLLNTPGERIGLQEYDLPTLTAKITSGEIPVQVDPREPLRPDPKPEIELWPDDDDFGSDWR